MKPIDFYIITSEYIEFSGENSTHYNIKTEYASTIEFAIQTGLNTFITNVNQFIDIGNEAYFCKSTDLEVIKKDYYELSTNVKTLDEFKKFVSDSICDCVDAINAHEYYSFAYQNIAGLTGILSIDTTIDKKSFDPYYGVPAA